MVSHVRHRRGQPIPPLIEPGEVHVDAPSRQLTAGDIAPATGVPVPLIAVRYFDPRASYLIHDYVIQDGGFYRSKAAVPPGPFDPTKWEALVGGATAPTDPTHTPLHGFGDGANHTLILHATADTNAIGNTIDFNNLSGATAAKIWTTGVVGDVLRVQSAGNVVLVPGHIGFDNSGIGLEVNSKNVTIKNRDGFAALVLQQATTDGIGNILAIRNLAGEDCANFWTSNKTTPLMIQSAQDIRLAPSHTALDYGGTMLQVTSGGVHVYTGLGVDGGGIFGGSLNVGANIQMGPNSSLTNTGGYLVVQATAGLYLRTSSAGITIGDSPVVPTLVGGVLTVNGTLNGVQGGLFQNDVVIYRSFAPNTGVIYFGARSYDQYLYFDGTDLRLGNMRGLAVPGPSVGTHAANKDYVDSLIGSVNPAGSYLPLAGGTMSGQITLAPSTNNWSAAAGPVGGSIHVVGTTVGTTGATMTFDAPGFATHFGLYTDGNFYMGGWSHGATTYRFWTTREMPQNPPVDVRLSLAADEPGPTGGAPDPYPGAVVSGLTQQPAPPGSENPMMIRYRYLQVNVGGAWHTVGF